MLNQRPRHCTNNPLTLIHRLLLGCKRITVMYIKMTFYTLNHTALLFRIRSVNVISTLDIQYPT